MNRLIVVAVTAIAIMSSTTVATAGTGFDHGRRGHHGGSHANHELHKVKRANDVYRRASRAIDDGFGALDVRGLGIGHLTDGLGLVGNPTCFDNEAGGMGVHYVNFADLDGEIDALHPEAMVYEIRRNGELKLIAVEYVATGTEDGTPPTLFGQTFTWHKDIGVWKLHAWLWKRNPSGVFADWNPKVGPCPG